jgi:hypothetical protein
MKRGILYVVFGEEYWKIAAACMRISRKNTNYPFYVVTNLHGDLSVPDNTKVCRVNAKTEENRDYKTRMVNITPFDETLYLDCDSIIQRPGIGAAFDALDEPRLSQGAVEVVPDVVLNKFIEWRMGDRVLNIYARAMKMFGVQLPLTVYNGAFICFRKNGIVRTFFQLWRSYWEKFGRGREMPCLACAVKNLNDLMVSKAPKKMFEAEKLDPDVVVQHYTGGKFLEKFSLPKWTRWAPFDCDPNDFHWSKT